MQRQPSPQDPCHPAAPQSCPPLADGRSASARMDSGSSTRPVRNPPSRPPPAVRILRIVAQEAP